jgi:hypothetical protein
MWRAFALFAGSTLLVGCSDSGKSGGLPATYPVTGKVVDANGNPLKGGTVQFDAGKGADLSVLGVIGADGTYTVKTFRDKQEADGAPEGEYQVTVTFLLGGTNAPPAPVTLTSRFKVEARDNTLDIDLRKKGSKVNKS